MTTLPGAAAPDDGGLGVLTEAERRFERARHAFGLVAGPVAALALWLVPFPGIGAEAHRLAAVLGLVLVYWITEAIPIPVTALLGAALCVVLGVAPARTVLAPFADPIVFLFIGSFILARAMTIHRLDRRFAFGVLSLPWIGMRPGRILFAFGAISAFVSMWISNTATTAMMLPIGIGLLGGVGAVSEGAGGRAVSTAARSPYATGIMLMAAYAASVGGIGTPVGTPPNLIAIGMIDRLAGVKLTFLRWMALAAPMLIAMYAALYVVLSRLHRHPQVELAGTSGYLAEARRTLGPWTAGQRNCLIAFGVAVSLWVFPGIVAAAAGADSAAAKWLGVRFPEGIVAILAAALLFFLPARRNPREFTIAWRDAAAIDWGTILLFGGGLSLGGLMFSTGLAEALGGTLLRATGASDLWTITAAAIGLGILISETTSNTASANMVIPVVIAIAQAAGVSPLPPALGACFGASYGFMLPVSTPPNAIVYGSGLVPITRMMRAGIIFDLAGAVIIWAGLRVLCPLMGLD